MLNSIKSRITSSEQQTRFVQDRISLVDRQFAELCHAFGEYSRRVSKMRDRHNDIVKATVSYAESETINKSLSNGLAAMATYVDEIGEYGDLRVQNIDTKVVSELSHYGLVCKHAKDDLKHIFAARDRENTKKRSLDRLRERNPRNRQQLIQAETELVKATAEVSRSHHNLEDQTNAFERKKLHDIKGVLLDFITIEMGFYAKSLELLTKAYQDVDSIDEDADLKDFQEERNKFDMNFKKTMEVPETIPHSRGTGNKRVIFNRSTPSLGSITTLFSTTHDNARRSPGIPHRSSPGIPRLANKQISKSVDALDKRINSKSSDDSGDSETENKSESFSEPPPELSKRFVAPKYRK